MFQLTHSASANILDPIHYRQFQLYIAIAALFSVSWHKWKNEAMQRGIRSIFTEQVSLLLRKLEQLGSEEETQIFHMKYTSK